MPNNLLVYPLGGAAGPPGPPGAGMAILQAVEFVGAPFVIPGGGPFIVPGFALAAVVPASGIMVVNFNFQFGTAGGPIISPGLMYTAYLRINAGIPVEIGRYKEDHSGPGGSWEQGHMGGSVAFIVPPGLTTVDVFLEAGPGGVIELKPAPIKTALSMMA